MSERQERAHRVIRGGHTPLERLFTLLGGRRALYALATRGVTAGSAELILPDGRIERFTGDVDGPAARIEVLNWRALPRMATGGALGFARSYIDGDWRTDDLAAVTELASVNRQRMAHGLRGGMLAQAFDRLRHLLRANTRRQARDNIQYHYDLGNDFYAAWLDGTMTYSSALFADGDNSLEAAQTRKYRSLLDRLQVAPGDRILEIGSGWGGFAEIAARDYDAHVVGLTLSPEQKAYAEARIEKAGLSDRVTFKLQDYRDERESYDRVASIEMFEAVGERYWPAYFDSIRRVLRPGGRAGLQIITIDEALFPAYRKSVDFIQTYIFPGGMLPSLSALEREVARAGLVWRDMTAFGISYAETLAIWRERFNTAFDGGLLPQGFDETFRRLWNFYLAYCEGAFRGGSTDVVQISLEND